MECPEPRLDEDKKHSNIDVDKKKLENAPVFDKDNWPGHGGYQLGSPDFQLLRSCTLLGDKEEKTFRRGGGGLSRNSQSAHSGLNKAIPGYGFSCFPTGDAGLQESRRGWEPRMGLRASARSNGFA